MARVLEKKKVHVLQDVAQIERQSGLVHGVAGSVVFDQHQIQEVLYGSLIPNLQSEYHKLLAQAYADRIGGEPTETDAVFLATLSSFATPQAAELLTRHETRLSVAVALEACYLLWVATHDEGHLARARRHLDSLRAGAAEEFREAMIEKVPLHREVVLASAERGEPG